MRHPEKLEIRTNEFSRAIITGVRRKTARRWKQLAAGDER